MKASHKRREGSAASDVMSWQTVTVQRSIQCVSLKHVSLWNAIIVSSESASPERIDNDLFACLRESFTLHGSHVVRFGLICRELRRTRDRDAPICLRHSLVSQCHRMRWLTAIFNTQMRLWDGQQNHTSATAWLHHVAWDRGCDETDGARGLNIFLPPAVKVDQSRARFLKSKECNFVTYNSKWLTLLLDRLAECPSSLDYCGEQKQHWILLEASSKYGADLPLLLEWCSYVLQMNRSQTLIFLFSLFDLHLLPR